MTFWKRTGVKLHLTTTSTVGRDLGIYKSVVNWCLTPGSQDSQVMLLGSVTKPKKHTCENLTPLCLKP